MRTYHPPVPADASAAVHLVLELTRLTYDVDLVAIATDDVALARVRAHAEPLVHPQFAVELTFVAGDEAKRRGVDGLIATWRELLSVFSAYRPRLEEVVDAGGGRVALFGHDTVETADGLRLDIPVGSIYEVDGGLVRRAAFFPDQAGARDRLA